MFNPWRMGPYHPDESAIGVWFWLFGIIIGFNIIWVGMDVWLRMNNHEYLTTEFREGLRHPVWGPIIMGLVAFTIAAFLTHMFTTNRRE